MNTGPLIEREDAFALFEQATKRLDEGLGGIVLVSGEAGIGKTTLQRYFDTFRTKSWIYHKSGRILENLTSQMFKINIFTALGSHFRGLKS